MDSVLFGESFLLARFREFYHEVIRHKRKIQVSAVSMKPVSDEEDLNPGSNPANQAWKELLLLLERQEVTANHMGGDYLLETYKVAQFVMAALADEIFLNLKVDGKNWEGKENWQTNLLEMKLCSSHAAGDIFFEKLDHILRYRDPLNTELAKVFLFALALDFKGKYRDQDEKGKIEFYRKELFHFIYQRDPNILDPDYHFCNQAYEHNMEESTSPKLKNPRKWGWVLVGAVFLASIFSLVLWGHLVDDLNQVIQDILEGV
jgi:type VI secretion system protein ImpK